MSLKETSNIIRCWILYEILPDFADIYAFKSLVYYLVMIADEPIAVINPDWINGRLQYS